MSLEKRMNLSIAYIEENLDGRISIDDLAKVASCSKFHFQRVFFSCFDITVSDYIRKRKFTLAAVDLVSTQMSVMEIASKYGYDSPNAFTRAFRRVHGENPSVVRSSQAQMATHRRVSFPIEKSGNDIVDYTILERPSFNIVGKSKKFNFDEFVKSGPKFWKEYVGSSEYKELSQLNRGRPGSVSGAPLLTAYFPEDKSKNDNFIDVFGVECSSDAASPSFESHQVPAATYAEFNCSYRNSMKTNRAIYGEWFSATGYEREHDKPDVVAYFPMPYRHFSDMNIRWWVPIIAKG